MPAPKWSDEQRERALLALHDGATLGQVHAETGIPKGTLASWKRRQSVQEQAEQRQELAMDPGWRERARAAEERAARTAQARERRSELTDDDRKQMAGRLRDEVLQLLDRINTPTTYVHVKVLSDGADAGQHVEEVHVELDLPTAADTRNLVAAASQLLDKMQLLTGEATERTEHIGGPLDLDAEYERLVQAAKSGELDRDDA